MLPTKCLCTTVHAWRTESSGKGCAPDTVDIKAANRAGLGDDEGIRLWEEAHGAIKVPECGLNGCQKWRQVALREHSLAAASERGLWCVCLCMQIDAIETCGYEICTRVHVGGT